MAWKRCSSYLPPVTSKLKICPCGVESSTPANSGTTVSPCSASPRLPRSIEARRLALPCSDRCGPRPHPALPARTQALREDRGLPPEEPDEVEGHACGPGDADDREVIGGLDCLHRVGGDEVADRRTP